MDSLINDDKKFEEPIECSIWIRKQRFDQVTATFYRDDMEHKAAVTFRENDENVAPKTFLINDNWNCSTALFPAETVYFGYYNIETHQVRDFVLQFPTPIQMNSFVGTFESCVFFQNHFNEELNEKRIKRMNIVDPNAEHGAPNLYPEEPNPGTHSKMDIAYLKRVLANEDILIPKNNHLLRPYAPGIGRRAFNVSSKATKDQYLKYFDENDAAAVKSHWRNCPAVQTALPLSKRLECDPIFNTTVYDYVTLAAHHRLAYVAPVAQPAVNVPRVENQDDPFDD